MATLATRELQIAKGHQGVLLVHFKNISTPNLPKIFAYQFAYQFFVSSSRASGSAAGLKPGGRVRCLALSHAWVCRLLSQDHGPRHFLAPSSSAQDLALQPNFAKAYANLGLRQLSNGELDGTKASLPVLFRQNPGWLAGSDVTEPWKGTCSEAVNSSPR